MYVTGGRVTLYYILACVRHKVGVIIVNSQQAAGRLGEHEAAMWKSATIHALSMTTLYYILVHELFHGIILRKCHTIL